MAFLKQENMKISRVVHNQPFVIRPNEKQLSENPASIREEQAMNKKVDELKEKIRILVEPPLFFNGELLDNDLLERQARVLQIIHKQLGIYSLLRASQINQRKCLQGQLTQLEIGLSSLLSGVYSQAQVELLGLVS